MMVSAVADHLGVGIYSPAEAAFYARERTATVVRWLFGASGEPLIESQLDPSEKTVTFRDFIQMLAVSAIRKQYDVPLQTIRRGLEVAKKRYGVQYPLAMAHKTYLFERGTKRKRGQKADGSETDPSKRFEIIISLPRDGSKDDDNLVQVTGSDAGATLLKEVVELFLRDVSYDAMGIADEYYPFREGDARIRMNPHLHFGEPLTPSGYTALALWESVTAEGGIEPAAKVYGVEPKEVELAFSYISSLQGPPPSRDK
jgi:hypothetical protein